MCTLRETCIFAGAFTCIQSVLHLIITSYGLAVSLCTVKPTNTIANMLYYTYFCSEQCGSNITVYLRDTPTDLELSCDGSGRMNTYLFFYTVLSAMWLVSSVALVVGVLIQVKSVISGFFYFQWVIMTLVMLCVDLMATLQFSGDIQRLRDGKDWLRFVGVKNKTLEYELGLYNDSYGETFTFEETISENFVQMPTLLIMLVVTRCGVVYLANVILFAIVLVQAVDLFRETHRILHPMMITERVYRQTTTLIHRKNIEKN